ncbi:hypothetical protein [Hoeflea sp.]|uniref:polysaccharide deacetylase WbmS family protein n=1 Tax=Hoeflea sp. TaxID=1940281 RepID=UPI003A922231
MYGITFDVDWAPAWAVKDCADLCRSAGASATFFVTHECDHLPRLRQDPKIELGIHPNFLLGSSHGDTIGGALQHCIDLVPNAKSMRTHWLHQSTVIYNAVLRETSIEVDVSLFLPGQQNLAAHDLYLDVGLRPLRRLPYHWEDDIAAVTPGNTWDAKTATHGPGLKIFDFHPIHVALNTSSLNNYQELKRHMGNRPLYSATRDDIARFSNSGRGARDFLVDLLATGHVFSTVSALAGDHR